MVEIAWSIGVHVTSRARADAQNAYLQRSEAERFVRPCEGRREKMCIKAM